METSAVKVRFIPATNCFVHISKRFLNSLNSYVIKTTLSHGQILYLSCSSIPYNDENGIGMSAVFAAAIGLKENETVLISSVSNIPSASTVLVEPLSYDDWEILELCAEKVEGSMIEHIRVVYIGQVIPVWISNSSTVKIRVESIDNGSLQYARLEQQVTELIIMNFKEKPSDKISKENEKSVISDLLTCLSWKRENILPQREIEQKPDDVTEKDKMENVIFRIVPSMDITSDHNIGDYDVLTGDFFDKPINCKCGIDYNLYNIVPLTLIDTSITIRLLDLRSFLREGCEIPKCTLFISKVLGELLFGDDWFGCRVRLTAINKQSLEITRLEISSNLMGENSAYEEVSKFKKSLENEFGPCDILLNNNHPITTQMNEYKIFITPSEVNYFLTNSELLNPFDIHFRENCTLEEKSEKSLKQPESVLYRFKFWGSLINDAIFTIKSRIGYLRKTEWKIEKYNNLLIQGDKGTGKTSFMKLLISEVSSFPLNLYTVLISCVSLKGKTIKNLEKLLEESLIKCVRRQPAILFLDDVDSLCFVTENSENSAHSSSVYNNRLCDMIQELNWKYSKENEVAIVATASHFSYFTDSFCASRGCSLFTRIVKLPRLEKEDRLEVIKCFSNFTTDKLVQKLDGYCIQDIADFVDKLTFESYRKKTMPELNSNSIEDDIQVVLSNFTPIALQGIELFKGSDIRWKDIGALQTAKKILTEILLWPSQYPSVFKQCPIKAQNGILLYGAPGTGKTLLAAAVAGESNMNFISVKGPELLSKYIGGSEEAVRNIFKKAHNAKPCILFFDEFDSLAPRRGDDLNGVTDRVVNQLLTELDGLESTAGIWILAATSRPDIIDAALLRPGRLGTSIYCPLPNEEDRLSILTVLSKTMELSDDVNLGEISAMTNRSYTGADLKGLLYTAQLNLIASGGWNTSNEEDVWLNEDGVFKTTNKISKSHLLAAVTDTKPSLNQNDVQKFEKIYEIFEKNGAGYIESNLISKIVTVA